jgi:hypothetical protein
MVFKRAFSPNSRPPLERMLRIHQALQSGKFPNASTLACNIEFMRDRLGLPIVDLKIFDALAKAVAERQQLELAYRKARATGRTAPDGPASSGEDQWRGERY